MSKADTGSVDSVHDMIDKLYKSDAGYVGMNKLWEIIKRDLPGSHIKLKDVQEYYKSNVVEQRYKLATKVGEHTHIIANKPNDLHQTDLVLMDRDRGYRYFQLIIDVFTRYAVVSILKDSKSATVAAGTLAAYESDHHMTWPNAIMVDQGKEFQAEFKKLMDEHNVRILVNYTTDKRYTSIIERINQTIETPLFKNQAQQELARPADQAQSDVVAPVVKWIDRIKAFVQSYNNRPHTLLNGMTPLEAMERPFDVTYNYPEIKDERPMLRVGTPVKLAFAKKTGLARRHMEETHSNKVYYIYRCIPGTIYQPDKYILIDDVEMMPMTYYRDELQSIATAMPLSSDEPDNIETPVRTGVRLPKRVINRPMEPEEPVVVAAPDEPVRVDKRGRKIATPSRYKE